MIKQTDFQKKLNPCHPGWLDPAFCGGKHAVIENSQLYIYTKCYLCGMEYRVDLSIEEALEFDHISSML